MVIDWKLQGSGTQSLDLAGLFLAIAWALRVQIGELMI